MKSFYTVVTGNTCDSHKVFIQKLKSRAGLNESTVLAGSDFILAFCPVISRLGTDLEAAMRLIPVGKPVYLVVMHHTFNPHTVLPESSRLVQHDDIVMTVDCVFHETQGLLDCDLNDRVIQSVLRAVADRPIQAPPSGFYSRRWLCNNQLSILHLVIIVVSCILVAALILWGIIYASKQ